jgi:hypothetical protein
MRHQAMQTAKDLDAISNIHLQNAQFQAFLGQFLAKTEIFLGFVISAGGLLLPIATLSNPRTSTPNQDSSPLGAGLALFIIGGCLVLFGHRSHLYRWSNRNTVELIDEIRRSQTTREYTNEHISR